MSDELDAFFEMVKHAASLLFRKNGEHPPLYYCHMTDRPQELAVLDGMWKTPSEKNAKMAMMRIGIECGAVARCALVHEMWFATTRAGPGETIDMASVTPPSQRRDRQEMLMVIATDRHRYLLAQWEIKRDEAGKPHLEPFDVSNQGVFTGISDAFRALLKDVGTAN